MSGTKRVRISIKPSRELVSFGTDYVVEHFESKDEYKAVVDQVRNEANGRGSIAYIDKTFLVFEFGIAVFHSSQSLKGTRISTTLPCAFCLYSKKQDDTIVMHLLHTHASSRGLGDRLITEILKHGRQTSARKVFLEAVPDAIPFYQKYGFTLVEENPTNSDKKTDPEITHRMKMYL